MFDETSAARGRLAIIIGVELVLIFGVSPAVGFSQEPPEPKKSVGVVCGTCPEGYATTGVTQAPEICKEGDSTLVQCALLGTNLLAVCGSCPEGYEEIGGSSVPARCGSKDGGRLAQCQLRNMEPSLPDPNQGLKVCPPDCGSTGTPGQGAMPPPPKYQPMPGSQ